MCEPEDKDLTSGSMDWGDYDNNGRSDLLLTGSDTSGNAFSGVFGYDISDALEYLLTYVEEIQLPGLTNGEGNWIDVDTDGMQDIFLCGARLDSCHLYRNTGDSFEAMGIGIPEYTNAASDWGDFDADGDPDLAICGNTDQGYRSDIYRNDGSAGGSSWIFTNIEAGLEGMESGDLAWADYDDDGDLDLIIAGNTGIIESSTILYENLEGLFVPSIHLFEGLGRSSTEWGDYDADGDLDLLLTGFSNQPDGKPKTLLYKNTGMPFNQPPSPPGGLSTETGSDWIRFSWDASTDDLTPAPALSYNLRIEKVTEIRMILSPMSLEDGTRMLPAQGDVGQGLSWTLKGVSPGNFTWSVQAIDQGFMGSAFAADQQVSIVSDKSIQAENYLHAFPNPFNDMTQIGFNLPGSMEISLEIFDMQGRKVGMLYKGVMPAGAHVFNWQPAGLPGGMYAVRLSANGRNMIFKLVYRPN
jgi:hypothetical protein